MNKKNVIIVVVLAVVIIGGGVGYGVYSSLHPQKVTLSETGSSLLYPLFNLYAANYTDAHITTASTGSGTGISSAIAGTVVIGASDAYLPASQAAANPSMMNIPIMISYQYVVYNIPNLNSQTLNISANMLVGIYNGSITNWNDPQIQAANPGVTLPSHAIVEIHRSDGSGDTFMFTSFLSKANTWWAENVGASTNPSWPTVSSSLGGNGNAGIIASMNSTQYSISYVAATYSAEIQSAGFGIADLLNQAGHYVAGTPTNVGDAAAQYLNDIPANGTIALQYAPGANSYPIADLEYVIVNQNQPDSRTASTLKAFLTWVVDPAGGSSSTYLDPLNIVALPSSVVTGITTPLINKITG